MLDPAGPSARIAAQLWWWMFGYAAVVVVAVVAFWLYALFRPHRELAPRRSRLLARRWVIGGGLLLPLVSVVLLLAFGIPAGHRMLPLHTDGPPPVVVEVIGRQWHWEVRYPEPGVRSTELRIPVGRAVDIRTTSEDVIHSFWVPRLAGKIDAIPGRYNTLRIEADRPGVYAGQCAEFCGLSHAHMRLHVEAVPAEDFDLWLKELSVRDGGGASEREAP